jgi:hypothetical protein
MRVELVYSPGCHLYKSLRNSLETVIAEECLPIPVEMVENTDKSNAPIVKIDGHIVSAETTANIVDQFRDLLTGRWLEITEHPLNRAA